MAKKKSDKEAEQKPASTKKYVAFFRNETIHFVIGLVLVIFSVYLLLALPLSFSLEQLTKVLLIAEMPRTLLL